MALSKKNPSTSTQLQSLVDLLVDLQILNPRQESTEESPASNGNAPSQGEPLSSQLVEECQEEQTNANAPNLEVADTPDIEVADTPNLEVADTPDIEVAEAPDIEVAEAPNLEAAETPDIEETVLTLSAVLEAESKGEVVNQNHPQAGTLERTELEPSPDKEFSPQGNGTYTEKISPSCSSTLSAEELATDDSHKVAEGLQNQLSESPLGEEQKQESKKQPVLTQGDLNQPKNSNTPPEQVFNRLIQFQWQKAQQKEYTSQSIASDDDKNIQNSIELFERWQRLILTQEVMDARQTIAKFKEKLENLEYQIYEPRQLINLLVPLITEILSEKVADSREDIAQAIAPIVDEMIQHRTQQDKEAISYALAPVLPDAVAKGATDSPGELAKALGPEMGTAIKEQINLERDAMVDALYPVIGSTISKYMAEAIRAINEKVENAFSLEGISRKIRAKMQGVSEAELILREAMPFTVQAIFLIHKGSGLVISEVQPSDQQHLESEMVAGMLTAIRSFVNDVIAQSGNVSEIDQIEYGNSKIILEVAGYCYLAVVIQGEPPKSFIQKMRGTLGTIVQRHGKAMELFDGDPSNVPEPIHQSLVGLTKLSKLSLARKGPLAPVGLVLVSLAVLGGIFIPMGIYQHLSAIDRRREEETSLALASDPELAVYRLVVEANLGTLKLSGRLPNQYLRSKAEQIAKKVAPKLKIHNAIIPVEVPPDPVLAQAEVKRVTNILNQMQGAVIWTDYSEGKVTVQGAVLQEADAKKITQAFLQIPGVRWVTNTVQLQPLAIASRVYFDLGSSEIKSDERSKISPIREFLKQYPNKRLRILGHTDPKGTAAENEPLALERAKKVRDALVAQGVDPKRLEVAGTTNPPIGVNAEQLPLLSRCVEFEIITP